MELYVGLDVSLKETSICVVDGKGEIVSEGTVISTLPHRKRARRLDALCRHSPSQTRQDRMPYAGIGRHLY